MKLLTLINERSTKDYRSALKMIDATDEFLQFCDELKNELIEGSGGMDTLKNRPIGRADKKIVEQIFFKEKKGKELKDRMEDLRKIFISHLNEDLSFVEKISLNVDNFPKNKIRWEEWRFRSMPMAATLPMISKIQNDALISELVVLEYLANKK